MTLPTISDNLALFFAHAKRRIPKRHWMVRIRDRFRRRASRPEYIVLKFK
jgi:hypothetical protein